MCLCLACSLTSARVQHFSAFIIVCVSIGLVGLAISYALSVTNLLSGAVTSFTETEKEMVSVERAMQYIKGAPKENTGCTSDNNDDVSYNY